MGGIARAFRDAASMPHKYKKSVLRSYEDYVETL